MTEPALTSRRPYLLRAMHEWMSDNGQTPHLLVDAQAPGIEIPPGHERDGKLVLNVSWQATDGLSLGNEWVEFGARFGGVTRRVRLPTTAVLGIYARETGEGMLFPEDEEPPPSTTSPPEPPAPSGRPRLTVVK